MAQHARVLNEINDNRKYPFTGTFHLTNLKMVQRGSGYQLLFWAGDEDSYTPQEYARIVNELLYYSTNHEADITKRNGVSQISFNIPNKRDAYRLSRKYGNNSVWDWLNNQEINTERRLRR